MVWINSQCINTQAPERYFGGSTFGGSMCACSKCKKARADRIDEILNEDFPGELKSSQLIRLDVAVKLMKLCVASERGVIPVALLKEVMPDIEF